MFCSSDTFTDLLPFLQTSTHNSQSQYTSRWRPTGRKPSSGGCRTFSKALRSPAQACLRSFTLLSRLAAVRRDTALRALAYSPPILTHTRLFSVIWQASWSGTSMMDKERSTVNSRPSSRQLWRMHISSAPMSVAQVRIFSSLVSL